jgi:sensor domain CHASE-containing protein
MRLRARTLLIVLLLMALTLLAAELSARWLIYPRFAELEREHARRNAELVIEFLNHEIETLSGKPEDWGYWDDTYAFVADRNADYIESNLGVRSQFSLRAHLLGFYDRAGRTVWARGLDFDTLLPFELDEYTSPAGLGNDSQFLSHEDAPRVRVGLVSSSRGPMLVASTPILTSTREGPSRGTIVMGRFFDPAAVRQIARQGRLDLSLRPHRGAAPPPPLPDDAPGAHLRLIHSPPVMRTTADRVWVSTIIYSIEGQPTLDLAVGTPREISARGVRALSVASMTMLLAGLAITVVLVWLLNRSVLVPILDITRHVRRIGGQDDDGTRLGLRRDDEIGELAAEFDRMLARIGETRQRLFDQSYRAGANEMASGVIADLRQSLEPLKEHIEQPLRLLDRSHTSGMQMLLHELADPALSRHRFGEIVPMLQDQVNEHAGLLAEARGELRGIRRSLERLQGIVTEYSRFIASPHQLEAVPLLELVEHALRKQLDVDVDPTVAKAPPVAAAREILQQVVNVLFEQAARAAPADRALQVRVTARRDIESGRPTVHLRLDDDRPALSPEAMATLFTRDSAVEDGGLTLPWAANAINALGGHLYAEGSQPFDGLVLHLVLPRANAEVE